MHKQRIVFILHNPHGCSGHIGEHLANDHHITTLCPLNGDPPPAPDQYDAAIVFGGKMSVNDSDRLPELVQECLWIKNTVDSGKPFLGICLGAQLLAQAYGAQVTRHPERITEIGYYRIYPTIEGYQSIFTDAPSHFFQWHNEGFTLPQGATRLASSDLYPNQAFRIGENAYGFQFHPEATHDQIAHWHQRDQEELSHPGAQTVAAQYHYHQQLDPDIQRWLNKFLQHWLTPTT